MNRVDVVFIADAGYFVPTAVAICSLIANRRSSTALVVHIVAVKIAPADIALLEGMASENVRVDVVSMDDNPLAYLAEGPIANTCHATNTALLKFMIPDLFPDLERILYIDGDVLVLDDLADLFQTDLGGKFMAAVPHYPEVLHPYGFAKGFKGLCFNSGVMLFDLVRMRTDGIREKLIDRKATLENKGLMDQLVFNYIADENGGMMPLAPRYNLMPIYLWQKWGRKFFTMAELNRMAGTSYADIPAMTADAAILHFPGHDKPWAKTDNPHAGIWHSYFDRTGLSRERLMEFNKVLPRVIKSGSQTTSPVVSVVIPVFNTAKYLPECLKSVREQTLKDIEIICVNDASTDDSLSLLTAAADEDPRIKVISLEVNGGPSRVRNCGLAAASGRYVYFLDSDDLLVDTALEWLSAFADRHDLDVTLFAMRDFIDSPDCGGRCFRASKASLTQEYPVGLSGPELMQRIWQNKEWRPCVPMRLIRKEFVERIKLKFSEGIIHEDNLFSFLLDFQADRFACVPRTFMLRRCRSGSITTTAVSVKNIVGYNVVVNEVRTFLRNHPAPEGLAKILADWIEWMMRQMVDIYLSLPEEQRGSFAFHGSPVERIEWQSIWNVLLFEKREWERRASAAAAHSASQKMVVKPKAAVLSRPVPIPVAKKIRRGLKSVVPFVILQHNVKRRCHQELVNPAKAPFARVALSLAPAGFAFCLTARKSTDRRLVKYWLPYGIMIRHMASRYGIRPPKHGPIGSFFRSLLPYGYILWWDACNNQLRAGR